MGQQQLLLLVLATIIVGLATVAGIQAFDEGQTQAAQDALVQRGIEIGNDVYAATQRPGQFGGIDLTEDNAEDIAQAAGYEQATISAPGAGNDAACEIEANEPVEINCGTDGGTEGEVQVEVEVNPDADDPVTVEDITISS